jgi:hypothetical protein
MGIVKGTGTKDALTQSQTPLNPLAAIPRGFSLRLTP